MELAQRKLILRFDRTLTTASKVASTLMNQLEVVDFSLAEPDLSSIVKQIYNGALSGTGLANPGNERLPVTGVVPEKSEL